MKPLKAEVIADVYFTCPDPLHGRLFVDPGVDILNASIEVHRLEVLREGIKKPTQGSEMVCPICRRRLAIETEIRS